MPNSLWHALQVMACQRGRIELDEVFGPEAKGFIASLNTEGHHRGAVAAVKSQQLKEVSSNNTCIDLSSPKSGPVENSASNSCCR